jgi:hypothetical protein
MLNKDSKHLSLQMVKFINLLSKSRLSDTNMEYKHDAATEVIRVYTFVLQPIYTYSAKKWLVPCDEIRVNAANLFVTIMTCANSRK